MPLRWKGLSAIGLLLLAAPAACLGASCTTQAELNSLDREALAAVGARISTAVVQQNLGVLQAALLPSEEGNWENIRGAVEEAAPLVKGGQAQIRGLYLLDNTAQSAPADTQFFCSNASGSMTVTITMRALPPGRYAVVLGDAAGAQLGGQMGFILAWDGAGANGAWKLGGVSVRQGTFGGARRGVVLDTGPGTGQAEPAVERLVLLRYRALPAGAGGFSFVAEPGEAGGGTDATEGLAADRFSVLDSRRTPDMEGRLGSPGPLAARGGPGDYIRIDGSD